MLRLATAACFLFLFATSDAFARTDPNNVVTTPASEIVVPPPASSTPPAADTSATQAADTSATQAPNTSMTAPSAPALPAEPDSSEIVPAVTTLPVTVILKDGTERHYVRAEASGSYLICWRPDGGTDNIKANKVARIMGDETAEVLKKGATAGKKKKDSGKPFLRGRPLPEMKTFLMVQAGGLGRADDHGSYEEDSHAWLELGWMKNQSPKFALGGTLEVMDDGRDYLRLAVKPRLRTWLGKRYAIDVAPGVFIPLGQSFVSHYYPEVKPGSAGFTGEVSFVAADWAAASYVVEVIQAETKTYSYTPDFSTSSSSGTEVYHYLGLKAGGGVGLFLAVLTFAGLFANN